MIAVYGAATEFFETPEAAIQKFKATNSGFDVSDIIVVIAGIAVIGALCYYSYQISENNKKQAGS